MVIALSQAWTKDSGFAADEYIRLQGPFLDFMRQHPGFLGRQLCRSEEDPTHFVHLRYFNTQEEYFELTRFPGYMERIDEMGAHMAPLPDGQYQREFFIVVRDDMAGARG
jgi:hypothetical protein